MKHNVMLFSLILALSMLLAACAPAVTPAPAQTPAVPAPTQPPMPAPTQVPALTPSVEIPNPAAKYCVDQGFKVEMRTKDDGSQFEVCKFPDGNECDEWAYFRGQCSPAKPAASTSATGYSKVGLELSD